MTPLILAIPSKGRLMEATQELLARAGCAVTRPGTDRGYRGALAGVAGIEVAFLAAAEIPRELKEGKADLGITGEDQLSEAIAPGEADVDALLRLGFGPAQVVVAVPACWLDVAAMSDLDDVAASFYARHGRRLRVATKYPNLTRRFFAAKGVAGYRIVESQGATEGAPAAGTAEIVVDITTTGATLKANHLKVLDDGLILDSQAVLAATVKARDDPRTAMLCQRLTATIARAKRTA
jgi:ATP phosphoribosyltransferase